MDLRGQPKRRLILFSSRSSNGTARKVSWTGGGPGALTWPSVSEPGRYMKPTVWTLLRLSSGSERLEATVMNVRSTGRTNAEIVNFLLPPQSPERLTHPGTCLGLYFSPIERSGLCQGSHAIKAHSQCPLVTTHTIPPSPASQQL